MSEIRTDADSQGAGGASLAVFCLCVAFLGFAAGSFVMYRDLYPASYLARSYQAGFALFDKTTGYMDPLTTDLWRPARTDAKGVVAYDPERSAGGLTLYTSGHEQKASLIDMDGRVVHEWSLPYSQVWDDTAAVQNPQPDSHVYIEKAHVYPNGDLLALYVAVGDSPWGYGLVKMNRDSEVIWKYLQQVHHDFDVAPDGRIHVLTHEIVDSVIPGHEYLEPPRIDDFAVTLSPDGEELSKTWLLGAVTDSPYGRRMNLVPWYAVGSKGDYLHTNAIEEIGNTAKLPGVPQGSLLLSFREIGMVAALDPETEEIVWGVTGSWMRQHDPDLLANGNILLFDNEGGYGGPGVSRVIEIDPATQEIVWSYEGTADHPLESIVRSSQNRLPDGNTLIVESDAGRLVEVTTDGDIVWEFVNPVRGGEGEQRIPIIFWVQRLDPANLEPDFRESLALA
ncbi:MAG TPA: arylsulfotransferase family protein [Alphaproteobacteria bacterium]|nr:arylsulfotransferase family protein [Alphaproteobacteria bacterium]